MKRLLILFFIGGLLISCSEKRQMPITELTSSDLENAVLLDVRTPEEFAEGHLEGAVNMDWYQADFTSRLEAVDRGEKVYVYCKRGGRSAEAAQLLDSLGYKVIDLTGGYDAWLEAKD
ncbi:rhodanese-like domain-containing protein [Lentiprolixibacter aurantiacus]|uniref:Rhodanese-like domain-containing protein n=1 Tax=Lentiprolixibacter aurantiacus TaxID=2993939 RepID=A0AAE3MNN3_9FLAO|nr:rhodanese-like domain-containing protein [Lentiprolixibacter aurantiacus]MCX2720718.1 rhodanese-like domain-containing protein [Lentiprolixibacter aurantiacus]